MLPAWWRTMRLINLSFSHRGTLSSSVLLLPTDLQAMVLRRGSEFLGCYSVAVDWYNVLLKLPRAVRQK